MDEERYDVEAKVTKNITEVCAVCQAAWTLAGWEPEDGGAVLAAPSWHGSKWVTEETGRGRDTGRQDLGYLVSQK